MKNHGRMDLGCKCCELEVRLRHQSPAVLVYDGRETTYQALAAELGMSRIGVWKRVNERRCLKATAKELREAKRPSTVRMDATQRGLLNRFNTCRLVNLGG